ncbi:MAG: hypothetical protein RL135_1725, partial [Bacteroidota bacterium]
TTSNNECLFPLGSPNKKHQLLYITSTSAPTVGGLLSVEYLPYFAGTAGLPLVDTSSNLNLNRIHSGFYNISIENGLTGGAYNIKAMPLDIGNVNWEGALRMLKRDGVSNNWRLEPGSFGGGHSAYIPSIGIYGTSSLNGQYVIASDSNINTLPIQLTQLKGAYEAEQISLYWTTVSEVNAKEFVVSVLDQTEWKVMQKIGAFGNSSQIRNYHSRFNYASKDGKVTVKLEAFDRDGSNSISKQITLENNQKLPDISLYPNPFSEELQVQYFGSNQSAFADIFIYDETGKLVQQNQIYFTTNQTQIINVGELSPGFYLIKVTKEGRTHFYRQVKL